MPNSLLFVDSIQAVEIGMVDVPQNGDFVHDGFSSSGVFRACLGGHIVRFDGHFSPLFDSDGEVDSCEASLSNLHGSTEVFLEPHPIDEFQQIVSPKL